MPTIKNPMLMRFIVPFYLGKNDTYETFCRAVDGDDAWKAFAYDDGTEYDTFDYLRRSVCDADSDSNIGRVWHRVPQADCPVIRYTKANQFLWKISDMGLYCFRTNVGFLWYELSLDQPQTTPPSVDTVIQMLNVFKELCRTEKSFEQQTQAQDGTPVYAPFSAAKWIVDILSAFSDDLHFLYGARQKENKEMPDKALLFNLFLFDDQADDETKERNLKTHAYLLTNGYTRRYLPTEDKLTSMKSPFRDVCWFASGGNCGYYANLNEGNVHFFTKGLLARIRGDYFFCYMLALHQSYSLLNFLRRITAEQSADPSDYIKTSESGAKLDALVAELNTFLMKGIYTSVSTIQHHNDFFSYLQKNFRITEDVESLTMGLDALVTLQRMIKEKEEDAEQKAAIEGEAKRDQHLNFVLAIISVFSVFSAFADADACFDTITREGFAAFFGSLLHGSVWDIVRLGSFCVIFVIAVVAIVVLVSNSISAAKNSKKK